MKKKILYIVHCIDTEGPLNESYQNTIQRVNSAYNLNLKNKYSVYQNLVNHNFCYGDKIDTSLKKMINKKLLKYNKNWRMIDKMLDTCLSKEFRYKKKDDFGQGWIYSWHCLDHIGYKDNPRNKSLGYGKIFNYYKNKLLETNSKEDEINWHFHPIAINNKSISCTSTYAYSYQKFYYILARRIIDDKWFPTVNRQGFNAMRQDSHSLLEQWIPFDFSNQYFEKQNDQIDINDHRFGDWKRSSKSWRGYRPSIHDYQKIGNCKRIIFRCLNIGTRFNNLSEIHIKQAFKEASKTGSAILAFTNHDYRDIIEDIVEIRDKIFKYKSKFPDVKIKFSGANYAAKKILKKKEVKNQIKIKLKIKNNILEIDILNEEIFGNQPFLALKLKNHKYLYDNLDIIKPGKKYRYIFDDQTLEIKNISKIGVGTASINGNFAVKVLTL